MGVKVWINGELCDEAAATVSVFDRGFLYGDSVYEVMRTAGGRPVDLEPHLARLARSAQGLMLAVPPSAQLRAAIAATLEAAGNDESYVRVVITRGAGEIGLDLALARDPRTIIIVKLLQQPPRELYERGAALQIVQVQRTSARAIDPALKSGNYLNSILALAEARRAGAHEALMCDAAGRVAEGSSSNVFVVKHGAITTPALEVGLLRGITRERILELARAAGFDVSEGAFGPQDVRGADEVFITSSIRGVLPIVRVDGAPIGDATPGPITRDLMNRYDGYLARFARDGQ